MTEPEGVRSDVSNLPSVGTNHVPTHLPGGVFNPDSIRKTNDANIIDSYLSDEARFPSGRSTELVQFLGSATALEVATVLNEAVEQQTSVVIQGARTSLTGATVPRGDIILDMSQLNAKSEVIRSDEKQYVSVGPGVTLSDLGSMLSKQGLFFPASPTYLEATVVGAISTNAAGARSYKYGGVRQHVEGLKVILPSGELLDIRRGQYVTHRDSEQNYRGVFYLESQTGDIRELPVPTYNLPDVPKISAGYFTEPQTDLIDLFIGSEGTLGVITEATIAVMPEPKTYMALVRCESDEQAFELMAKLRQQEPDKRQTLEPGGISAVEYIGPAAIGLVRNQHEALAGTANALVLVQIEQAEPDDDTSLEAFIEHCDTTNIDAENIAFAEPYDTAIKDKFIELREAVPIAVNEQISRAKQTDPAVTKVAADPCVDPEDLGHMVQIYQGEYDRIGVPYFVWGHGEGNLHFNVVPSSATEVELAKQAVLAAGVRVIAELHGTALAEHGVGKNEVKQQLLEIQFGKAGIDEMRILKRAIDPMSIMSPDNIFPAHG